MAISKIKLKVFSGILTLFLIVFLVSPANCSQNKYGSFLSLDELAIRGMAKWDIPGVAYVIVSGDRAVHKGCFGVRKKGETGSDWKVRSDTVFQIGSMSKAFTSTLVAMLVDEDRLSWQDRVEDHLPSFRLYDYYAQKDFRIFDLMSQHSGLPDHSLDAMAILGYDRRSIIKALRFVVPDCPFRSGYAYQNVFYLCSDSIIENITGKSWDENLRDRIFEPLGMDSARSTFEGFTSSMDKISWLHRIRDGSTEFIPMDWPWQDWVYTMGPAGSISFDLDDLERWLAFLTTGGASNGSRLLSKEQMDFLIRPQTILHISGERSLAYCQGWVKDTYRGSNLIWHNGATMGAHSIIAFMPDRNVGIAVLTNQVGNDLPMAMMLSFVDLVTGMGEADRADWLKVHEEDRDVSDEPYIYLDDSEVVFSDYIGKYENSIYGDVLIINDGGQLYLKFSSPKPQSFSLSREKGDRFSFCWDVFTDPINYVKFKREEGKIKSLYIEKFDDTGLFIKE